MRTSSKDKEAEPSRRGRPSMQFRAALAVALARIDSSEGAPLDMSELCRKAGVSQRTMRAAFKALLGMAPNQYIRMRRLNLVRAALSTAHPEHATVAVIGKRYGFRDPGRMAGEYYALFGEYPSHTLRSSGLSDASR